ncbi:unnamed protein product [Ectocarpus sp. CCAP 1310/34]|nr:unnamed protein product [Ectocarpus sp. CCAP 1310/34]
MAGPPVLSRGAVDQEAAGGEPEPQRWCVEEPCRRRPFFGPPGGKPMYCAPHARNKEGMVDVSSRRCEAVGCAKWPLYGNEVRDAFAARRRSVLRGDMGGRLASLGEGKLLRYGSQRNWHYLFQVAQHHT